MLYPRPKIETTHLIQAKLYRPQVNASLVKRSHLLARLNAGLNRKLILVSAPPGYGKTTLATQWLADLPQPSTWLSLDNNDNTLSQFLRYICAAVRRCFPQACSTLHHLLATANLPDVDYLASLLVKELNALSTALILVLDDYHSINAPEIHHVMRYLLQYLPLRLQLMMLTRTDPPLFLGRLRASQQISEIRAADLCFNLSETRRFLQNMTHQPLNEKMIHALQTQTEGWAMGLQLAGISLQRHPPDQFVAHFGGQRLLAGYLVEEVMAGLPEAVSEFLIRTALVERFCAPLGDALLAGSAWSDTSQTTIAQLEAQNLFITSLDDASNWYRYHGLFHDFLLHLLKQKLGTEGMASLHKRASVWLAQAGLIEDALHHSLAAGDETAAAELVEANLQPLLNQGNPTPVLGRWLDMFPEQTICAHPGLGITQLCLFALRWDLAALANSIDETITLVQADSRCSEPRRQQRLAVLDYLHGHLLYWQGHFQRAIPILRSSLDNLTNLTAHEFTISQATMLLALAYNCCGARAMALTLLRAALDEAIAHHRPTMMIFLGVRILIHMYAGELAIAAVTAEQLLEMVESPVWSESGSAKNWRGWGCYLLGAIHYEKNNLALAARHWQQVEAMRYQVNPGAFHNSLIGLALIAQIQNESERALAYAQAACEFAHELRSPPLLASSEALEARLTLLRGNHAEALYCAQKLDTSTNQSNTIWLEPQCLTVLRVLLAEATPAALQTAEQLVATILDQAENAHNVRQIIPLLALQALVWRALRHTSAAFNALEQALTLAEPGCFTRAFLDLGTPMAELLQEFARRRGSSATIKRLLAAFVNAPDTAVSAHRELMVQVAQLHDISPLTQRELELLPLVAQRLTIAEIARELVISPNTVKKHLSNIYTKLGVHNRRQAVAKVLEIGLLPPV